MKIGIFTGRPISPLHPRIETFIHFLSKEGYTYDIIAPRKKSFFSRINWLSLWFFDNYSIITHRKKIKLYDIIFVQDLKYLPLSKQAKKLKKTVIYETLDNNVALRLYDLLKKISFLKLFQNSIKSYFVSFEKRYASKYCDKVVVNSKALLEYFDSSAELIYYSSSFESITTKNDPTKPTALIYLGDFSIEKGALDVLKISKDYGIEVFIFGTIRTNDLRIGINKNKNIHFSERINHTELTIRIIDLLNKYFLIGTSFIKPVHYSYATQEANKDIDYLSLGIPIIGNHRLPTEEKILAGCGVFIENSNDLIKLFSDIEYRSRLSLTCKEYYNNNYSEAIFTKQLKKVFFIKADRSE